MKKHQADSPTDAFVSFDRVERKEVVVRRSDLESMMVCPAMHKLMQREAWAGNRLTQVGEAIHRCLGEALRFYVEDGTVQPEGLRQELLSLLQDSRPDVQPQVMQAARRMIYPWVGYISRIPRHAILAFDGGEDVPAFEDESRTRSGQLSWKIDWQNMVVTSEVDLLHATRSPEVLCEVDYKSGWKRWDYEEVSNAFQFNLHAWLVFNNFPDVEFLDVRIWNARSNDLSPRQRFSRKEFGDIDARVQHAASLYRQYESADDAPAWPDQDKCNLCPVAADCPSAMAALRGSPVEVEEALRQLIALNEAEKSVRERLWSVVQRQQEDIVLPDGTAFGYDKPVARRKSSSPVYKVKHKKG